MNVYCLVGGGGSASCHHTHTHTHTDPVPPYSPPFSERVPQQSVQDMKEAVVKCRYRPAIPDHFIKDKVRSSAI